MDLTAIQRQYYQTKVTGATAQTPLHELEMSYWRSRVGGSTKFREQLEKEWLNYEIGQAGGTPSGSKYSEQLWRELVTALGLRVSKYVNENKLTFFLNT